LHPIKLGNLIEDPGYYHVQEQSAGQRDNEKLSQKDFHDCFPYLCKSVPHTYVSSRMERAPEQFNGPAAVSQAEVGEKLFTNGLLYCHGGKK